MTRIDKQLQETQADFGEMVAWVCRLIVASDPADPGLRDRALAHLERFGYEWSDVKRIARSQEPEDV